MHTSSFQWVPFRIVIALAVLMGSFGSSFGSLPCATGRCGNKCAMHESKPPPEKEPRSCCKETSESKAELELSAKGECHCSISSPEAVPAGKTVIVPIIPELVIGLPEAAPIEPANEQIRSKAIHFSGDSSPPLVVRHPDRGRAPPAAP